MEGRKILASFHGEARYRPLGGTTWRAQVEGRAARLALRGLDWTLAPWSAALEGGPVAVLRLELPTLGLGGVGLGSATFRGVELELVGRDPGPDPQERPWNAHARAESAELRLPRGVAEASGLTLDGRALWDGRGWPFAVGLAAQALVYKGFPFIRLSGLRFRGDGRVGARSSDGRGGLVSGGGAVSWQSRQVLEADSGYGPLQAHARASGTLVSGGILRVSELYLTGQAPQGLWSLMERFNAGLADQLLGSGLVHRDAGEVRVRAEYRAGGWHAPAAER
jgi:hypothetical protein